MLNTRNFWLLVMLVFCANLCPNQSRADDNNTALIQAIYPKHAVKLPMGAPDQEKYSQLFRRVYTYVGDRFSVQDPQCLGGVVTLAKEINWLSIVKPYTVARSIDKDGNVFFVPAFMLHGATCQTGLVFSREMRVKLVATYILGGVSLAGKITTPTVLTVYVKNPDNLKYLPVLERWAAAENRLFSANPGMFAPKTYETRVYDLHCKTKGERIDVPECRMHPAELHASAPAKHNPIIGRKCLQNPGPPNDSL